MNFKKHLSQCMNQKVARSKQLEGRAQAYITRLRCEFENQGYDIPFPPTPLNTTPERNCFRCPIMGAAMETFVQLFERT